MKWSSPSTSAILLLLQLLVTESLCASLGSNRKLDFFGASDGLSHGLITSLAQDNSGYIWVGTQNGVNRFDGYEFESYFSEPDDPASLTHSFVWSIYSDSLGNIWIGTRNGLNLYLKESNSFEQYLMDREVRVIHELDSSHFLIGTTSGLVRWSKETGVSPVLNDKITSTVRCIVDDGDGRMWVCTEDEGLLAVQVLDGEFKVAAQALGVLNDSHIRALGVDKSGNLWVGTYDNGLYFVANDLTQIIPIDNEARSAAYKRIRSLMVASNGDVFVGSDSGLRRICSETRAVLEEFEGLESTSVNRLAEDRGGTLWLGTFGGIVHTRLENLHFKWIRPRDRGHTFMSFFEPIPGTLISGTSKGFVIWTDNFANESLVTSADIGLVDSRISSVVGYKDEIWFGTMAHGLYRSTSVHGPLGTVYRSVEGDDTSLSSNSVSALHVDSEGALWVATYGGGVNRYLGDGKFRRFPDDTNPEGVFSSLLVLAIESDDEGNLWLATDGGGVIRLDKATGNTTVFRSDSSKAAIASDFNTSLEVTSEGVWVGSINHGLSFIDSRNGKVERVLDAELGRVPILGIVKDRHGDLWISNPNGIARYSISSGGFHQFDSSHGVQPFGLAGNVEAVLDGGKIVFGGINGVTVFSPSGVSLNGNLPPVSITNVRLDGEMVQLAASGSQLSLPYWKRSLVVQFAALDYFEAKKNLYKYKLEGFDPDWIDNGTDRDATYTNLGPGEYTFRVIGSNNDGVWNTEGASLPITVQPAPWATWWAYALYFLLIAALYYSYHRWNSLRAMRDSEKLFNQRLAMYLFSLNQTDECVFNADVQERIIFVNTPAVKVFDRHIGHLKSSPLFEVIFQSEDERSEARAKLDAEGRYKGEVRYEVDGCEKVLEVNLSKFDDPADDVSYVGVVRDVTAAVSERQAKEKELQRAALEIQERKEMLERDTSNSEAENLLLAEDIRVKDELLRNIHDRVNDNLLMLNSLLNIQASKIKDPLTLSLLDDSQQRVMALSLVHENILDGKGVRGVAMRSYLDALTSRLHRRFAPDGVNILLNLVVDDIVLDIEQAVPCGMIVNELVINSLVHAFADKKFGSGNLSILLEDMDLDGVLTVSDDGCGMPLDLSAGDSMGMEIVTILSLQLGGRLKRVGGPGTTFEIRFPITRR